MDDEERVSIENIIKELRAGISIFYRRWWDEEDIDKVFDYYLPLIKIRNLEWALKTGEYEEESAEEYGGVINFLYD